MALPALRHLLTLLNWLFLSSSEFAPMEIVSDLLNAYLKSLCSYLSGTLYCRPCLWDRNNQAIVTFILSICIFLPLLHCGLIFLFFYFLILFPILPILIVLHTQFSLVVPSASIVKKTVALCDWGTAFFFGTKMAGIMDL